MSHREVQVIINCSPTAATALEDQTNNAATVALMFQIGLWDFVSPLLSCVGDTEDCVCILCGNFSRHQKGSFDLTVTLSLLLLAPHPKIYPSHPTTYYHQGATSVFDVFFIALFCGDELLMRE